MDSVFSPVNFLLQNILKSILAGCILIFSMGTPTLSYAQDSYMKGKSFAIGDYSGNKMCVVNADGTIKIKEKAIHCNDLWVLPEGHILFTTGRGVKEIDSKGNVCFEYTTPSEVYAVQRLKDGNTFIGECSTGKLLTISPDGKVIKSVSIIPNNKGNHAFMRNARILDNGHYLVTLYREKRVAEFDANGTEVWSCNVPAVIHSAARLANGNTLVACGDQGTPCIQEIAPDKTVVWQLTNDDLEGEPLKFLCGFQLLPNGNLVISNWIGHGFFGKAPHLLEVTRDKKVVWTYDDHKNFLAVASIYVIDENVGKPSVH